MYPRHGKKLRTTTAPIRMFVILRNSLKRKRNRERIQLSMDTLLVYMRTVRLDEYSIANHYEKDAQPPFIKSNENKHSEEPTK